MGLVLAIGAQPKGSWEWSWTPPGMAIPRWPRYYGLIDMASSDHIRNISLLSATGKEKMKDKKKFPPWAPVAQYVVYGSLIATLTLAGLAFKVKEKVLDKIKKI